MHLPNYAAYKEGIQGVGFFLRSDYRNAIPHLERATELDASFAWASIAAGRYLGVIAARQGRRDDAARVAAELRDLGRPYLFGVQTLWRARIAALLGDGAALELLRSAISLGLGFSISLHTDVDFESLRADPAFRELLEPQG